MSGLDKRTRIGNWKSQDISKRQKELDFYESVKDKAPPIKKSKDAVKNKSAEQLELTEVDLLLSKYETDEEKLKALEIFIQNHAQTEEQYTLWKNKSKNNLRALRHIAKNLESKTEALYMFDQLF